VYLAHRARAGEVAGTRDNAPGYTVVLPSCIPRMLQKGQAPAQENIYYCQQVYMMLISVLDDLCTERGEMRVNKDMEDECQVWVCR
jgi:hypothetical protein